MGEGALLKRLIYSLLWIAILFVTVFTITSQVKWNPLLIFTFFALTISFGAGIYTLMMNEKIAHIPLLLGLFTCSILCTILEVRFFFGISFLFYVALMVYLFAISSRST